jgi:Arm DNA-binding domain
MALNDKRLQSLRSNPVVGKHTDNDGLFLKVTEKGGMYWQWRIRTPKETLISYGTYPDVSLAEARERHRQARQQRRNGIHPNDAKRDARLAKMVAAGNSFEIVAREWFDTRKGDWAPSYGDKVIRRLESDVFPYVGDLPVSEILPPVMLSVLRRIEARGAIETAHRALENCSQVFRYGVVTGRLQSDPSRDLKDALRKPTVKHMPAITDPRELAGLLRAIDGYSGTHVVRAALKLAPMLMLRPGELRFAKWDEFDLDAATWTIPAARMKRQQAGKVYGDPHAVPLPSQAVAGHFCGGVVAHAPQGRVNGVFTHGALMVTFAPEDEASRSG